MTLPKDPNILFSFINTKLRDQYSSFDMFCEDFDICGREVIDILENAGFKYDPHQNKFKAV